MSTVLSLPSPVSRAALTPWGIVLTDLRQLVAASDARCKALIARTLQVRS
jgi:hypothetical protein